MEPIMSNTNTDDERVGEALASLVPAPRPYAGYGDMEDTAKLHEGLAANDTDDHPSNDQRF